MILEVRFSTLGKREVWSWVCGYEFSFGSPLLHDTSTAFEPIVIVPIIMGLRGVVHNQSITS